MTLNNKTLSDKDLFEKYKSMRLPDQTPDQSAEALMAMAEAAMDEGDLAFLDAPLDLEPVPASLLTRAQALAPRTTGVARAPWWRQAIIAITTLAAFSSGSYALASTLTVSQTVTDTLDWDTSGGLFENATDTGLLGDLGLLGD